MNLDDHTLYQYRALAECPQGQKPGEVFEATADVGHVLITVGCAEAVTDSSGKPKKAKGYKRRDQRAED